MSMWKKITSFLNVSAPPDKIYITYARCRRCGEMLKARINLQNDLSLQDDGFYIVNKTLIGENLCFERIEISLTFNKNKELIDQFISRGEFITAEAYGDVPPEET